MRWPAEYRLTMAGEGVPGGAPSPAASLLDDHVMLTIDPADVERGDVLVGCPGQVVDQVVLIPESGWTFWAVNAILIDRRRIGARVQVIRRESDDDVCPVFGIVRPAQHLELVR